MRFLFWVALVVVLPLVGAAATLALQRASSSPPELEARISGAQARRQYRLLQRSVRLLERSVHDDMVRPLLPADVRDEAQQVIDEFYEL